MFALKRSVCTGTVLGWVGRVHAVLPDGSVALEDGSIAHIAASCLLRPECGDRVLTADVDRSESYVVAVLERRSSRAVKLEVPGAEGLTLTAPRLTFVARETIELLSLRDIDMTAAAGRLSINVRHMAVSAIESIVQNAKDCVECLGTYALQVRSLLRMHGQQTILTAERDMKIDAEQISVG